MMIVGIDTILGGKFIILRVIGRASGFLITLILPFGSNTTESIFDRLCAAFQVPKNAKISLEMINEDDGMSHGVEITNATHHFLKPQRINIQLQVLLLLVIRKERFITFVNILAMQKRVCMENLLLNKITLIIYDKNIRI